MLSVYAVLDLKVTSMAICCTLLDILIGASSRRKIVIETRDAERMSTLEILKHHYSDLYLLQV